MDIPKLLAEKKPLIEKEIEKVLPRKASAEWLEKAIGKADYSYDLETISKEFNAPVWEFLDRGGKRWRPALMLSACKAAGGKEQDAMPFTPLAELVHEGTIIVDDIEDNAEVRRGKKALHLMFGTDTAINDGNALYFLPLTLVYRNAEKLPESKRLKIMEIYGEEMLRLSLGQAMDIHWHKGKGTVKEEDYLQMCAYKTGVLARLSAKLGGILGNGTAAQVEALGKFGEAIGVGFQIQDDILNIAPASGKWGKEIGEDISEGKRTLLVLHALKHLGGKEAKELLKILDSHTKNKNAIMKAIALIKKAGSIEYAGEKAKKIVRESWRKLEGMLPESEGKQELEAFAKFMVDRKI
ncbi:MAG: polyprenyl synthetase family protein [Candidatus Diapherotrites archaeon]|nr:polyprenyl synthetase family protein [Candidatus Diapherotrites archaeon]